MFQGHSVYFQNYLSEASLTQNQETTTLQTLTTVDSLYFIMRGDPTQIKHSLKQYMVEGPGPLRLHTTLEGPWPHYMISEVVFGQPLDIFF